MAGSGEYTNGLGLRAVARRVGAAIGLTVVLALSGCAAPPAGKAGSTTEAASTRGEPVAQAIAAAPAAAPPPTTGLPPRSKPAPPMSDPLPAQRAPDAVPAPGRLNVSCKSNADCVVKDVGNCCGYYPRCVNVNAAVDPKAVQAQCARSGMMSVCGFKSVESCECVKGECQDKPMALEAQ